MRPILSALIVSAALLSGGIAGAQPVPQAGMPDAESGEMDLPQALRGLGLSDVRISTDDDDDERYIHARLPQGGYLRAEAQGDLIEEVQSDDAGLPQALIDALLPEPIRADARMTEFDRITEIELDDDGEIAIEGYATNGMRLEIEFARNGTLLNYALERDDRRSLAEPAARARLAALGYSKIGIVHRGGRHVEVVAQNPYGEWVEVRLDELGRVERERMVQP